MSGEGYTIGTCRYCGQVVSLERERDTQEAADIAASEECSCYDARAERSVRRQIENAQDRIQKIFGSEAEELGFRPINAPEPVTRYAGIEISDEDVYILACLVYHEARGESFEGQVAVIEVVLNRCLSDYFPDTVEEVVFQKYGDVWQFSPAPYLYTAEPTETQYEAVYTAIAAEEPILPLDTVYFSTEPYNDSIVEVIGNHYFCSIF